MSALTKSEPKTAEKRRHQRVKVVLLGRYMLSDRHEYPCQSIDISPGGVSLIAPVSRDPGERVVCYFDQIGRIEGVISRQFANGFALSVNVPLAKREKLAEQLTWLVNRQSLGMPEDRRHERIMPRIVRTIVSVQGEQDHPAKILDVSQSGVAVAMDLKLPFGTAVSVGKTAGRVVRVFKTGIAVEFSRLIPIEIFGEDLIL